MDISITHIFFQDNALCDIYSNIFIYSVISF
jgi:hypothetical protein